MNFFSSLPAPPRPPRRPPAPPLRRATVRRRVAVSAKAPEPAELRIVGQWREAGSKDLTEFHPDGTLRERFASGGLIEGRYTLDGVHLVIQLQGAEEQLSFQVTLGHRSLELTDGDGHITRYRRL